MADRPDAPTLHVRLHGDAAVLLPQGQRIALERRAAALLALAVLAPGISRLQAAWLLWPDSNDPRHNLRQQLLRFRQQFGRDLLVGQGDLRLAPGVGWDADGDAHGAVLLGAMDFADCEDFGAWLAQQRATARARRSEALRQQMAACEAAGELDAALAVAQARLALAPQDEAHHHDLMRLHYLRGDWAAGLAAHRQLVALLAAEFGTSPSAATAQLAAALQAGAQQGAGAAALAGLPSVRPALPVTLTRPPLLAGRAAEVAAARAHWADGRAVLLQGEAGLGKSRLMAELLAATPQVAAAAGRPGDAGVPYATLARLLRPLLAQADAALDAPTREALSHLAPAAAADAAPPGGAAPHPSPHPSPRQSERPPLRPGALGQAVLQLWQQHGVQAVALDDLHFADAATLDLLAGLIAQNDPPRHWLLAARAAEWPPAAQALCDALSELQRLGVVALTPLATEAIAALVDALGIDGLRGDALADALHRHTGGNPLFMLETLKQGLADGSLARGELPRPLSVGSLIERRLQRLSAPALTLARVAAIAGADFTIDLAEAAIGVRAVQLASPWRELQDAQVLRDDGFVHDLVGDAVRRSVPAVVARQVHAHCAQWLAAQGAEPGRVAWHWRHGGRPAEAGRAFVAAAQRAEQAARLPEEAALYAQAAQAFDEAGLADERFGALRGRVRALSESEFDDEALQACRALMDLAGTDAQRLQAHSTLCGLLTERGELSAALDAGQHALALAQALGDSEWQVRTACHLASALCRLGRADEAVALLAPLRAPADALPGALRMLWHGDWAAALGHLGRLGEAVAAYDTALAAARALGLRDAEGRLLLNCSVTLRQSGQLDRALALSRQGRALSAADLPSAAALPIDALVLARDEAETGHYACALAALEPALAAFQQRGTSFWAQACRMVLARLWLDLGQTARAVPLLRDEPDGLPAWLRADRRLLQLALARALERPAPPGALDDALQLAATDPQRGPALRVRALAHLPPAELAAQAQALAPLLTGQERFGALLALQVHLARAALADGRTDAAATAARAAMALVRQGCAPEAMYRPEACLVAWQALARAGAHAEAAQALAAGTGWVRASALPQVPAPFLSSFLDRNPVNRALLSASVHAGP